MRALVAAVVFLAAACGKPSGQGGPADAGQAYFKALNCRVCHRIGAEGGLGGPDLTMVGARRSKEFLDTFLKDPQAWKPGTLMPNPRLSDPARAALVGYLSGLKGQPWGGSKPWKDASLKTPVERGHVLFARAGCIACHGRGGTGGQPNNNVAGGQIPALDKVASTYTKEELVRKITRGSIPAKKDPAGPEPLVRMPAWGETLSAEEISDVADYVLTLKPGTTSPSEEF